MALQKHPVNINFSQGVNTKIDPFQLPIGQFDSLTNTIFNKDGLQTKRNGFGFLIDAPDGAQTLCTMNSGLVALGTTCQSYSADSGKLTNAGIFQPMKMSTAPMVRRATSQTTCDVAVASNGLACSVWLDSDGNNYYQISDSITGQIVIPAVTLVSSAAMVRVLAISNYFVITFLATVSAATHLQYILVPIYNPASPTSPVDISTQASSLTAPYDITTYSINLVVGLNCNDGGGAIRVWNIPAYNLAGASIPTPATVAGQTADVVLSAAVDISNAAFPTIWISYGRFNDVKAFALNADLTVHLAPVFVSTLVTPVEITSTAENGICSIVYEVANTYTYTPNAPEASDTKTDYVSKNTVDLDGNIGSPVVILRGVGLASKACLSTVLDKSVVLVTYGQQFQPTYFLIDFSGNVLARLAYSNGRGYMINQILPAINQDADGVLYVGYLFADLLQAVNKTQGDSTTGVYAQLGVNLATFVLNGQTPALEIGGTLHASGGMLWQYDGVKIREHGFNVWPEDLSANAAGFAGNMTPSQSPLFYVATYEWTDAAGQIHRSAPSVPVEAFILTAPATFTANRTAGSAILTSVSSFTGLQVGQLVTGTGIAGGSVITVLNPGGATLTLSHNALSGTSTVTTLTPTTLTSVVVNVPTLRQTYKIDNKVRIVIYRWSTTQQTYYRITSITSPVLNNPAIDSIQFVDTQSDAQIIGNDILYTTGGVIENICAPGAVAMTLWQSRLFLADAEDQNLIWYSKQVIEATPVEMSDLLTLFVAPTTGAQGSTGPITALSSMDDKLIVFKEDAIYYINGAGPDNTGAQNQFSDPVFITSTVGCTRPESIVLTPNGIMFQSDKGIWLLGRDLSTSYVGAPVERYTQGNIVTSALCIPATNQVRFTMDNRTAVMYDYYFNRWANWGHVDAISSVVYQSVQTYLNTNSQLVQETPNAYLDIGSPVLLSLTTGWINLAGLQGFERFYQGYLLGSYYTPFKLNVQLAYDYNPSSFQNIVITPDNFGGTWGSEASWGSGGPWGGPGNQFEARFFPSKQKCESFQLTINEIYDPTYGISPGAGLTLSGMNLVVGAKRGFRANKASQSFG